MTFSSSASLIIFSGDDARSLPQALCGTTDGLVCDATITVSFAPPVTAVAFYLGDLDRDNEGTVAVQVLDGAGGTVGSVSTNVDRRFFGFLGDDIVELTMTPSPEWELMDDLQFAR